MNFNFPQNFRRTKFFVGWKWFNFSWVTEILSDIKFCPIRSTVAAVLHDMFCNDAWLMNVVTSQMYSPQPRQNHVVFCRIKLKFYTTWHFRPWLASDLIQVPVVRPYVNEIWSITWPWFMTMKNKFKNKFCKYFLNAHAVRNLEIPIWMSSLFSFEGVCLN